MRTLILTTSLIILALHALSQSEPQIKISTGEGFMELSEAISEAQAKKMAYDRAIINAIENAFGRVIVQGNATYIENTTSNERVETVSNFSSISNSTVKGEVIEELDVKYDRHKTTIRESSRKKIEKIDIQCKVKVKVRELVDQPVDFETFPLNKAEGVLTPVTEFREGDDFYLYFKSPINGYISIYNDDQSYAQRLLPYRKMPVGMEDGMPIIANKEYVFFSDLFEHNYFDEPYFQEDVYQLATNKEIEHSRLFIIFSKSPIHKPILKANLDPNLLTDELSKQRFSQPEAMLSEDFQRWKIDNMSLRSDMQVKIIDYTIKGK